MLYMAFSTNQYCTHMCVHVDLGLARALIGSRSASASGLLSLRSVGERPPYLDLGARSGTTDPCRSLVQCAHTRTSSASTRISREA